MKNTYLTGNPGMDKKIIVALIKQGFDVTEESGKVVILGKNNKYGVAPKEDRTYKDGFVFASKNEMERWDDLLNVQRAGEISGLMRQVSFTLLDEFVSPQKEWGKQMPMVYVSDFFYVNISFRKEYPYRTVVEDSKTGIRTPEYKLKRKLFLYRYPSHLFFEV